MRAHGLEDQRQRLSEAIGLLQKYETFGRTRALELQAAALTLGVSELVILNHPDGALRWDDVTILEAEIVIAIRRYAPAAIITFGEDGLYWHLDHVGIHERTTAAVRSLGANGPPLYYVTMPPGIMARPESIAV